MNCLARLAPTTVIHVEKSARSLSATASHTQINAFATPELFISGRLFRGCDFLSFLPAHPENTCFIAPLPPRSTSRTELSKYTHRVLPIGTAGNEDDASGEGWPVVGRVPRISFLRHDINEVPLRIVTDPVGGRIRELRGHVRQKVGGLGGGNPVVSLHHRERQQLQERKEEVRR